MSDRVKQLKINHNCMGFPIKEIGMNLREITQRVYSDFHQWGKNNSCPFILLIL